MNYIISFLIAIFQILGLTTEARGESIESLKYAYWRDHTPNVVICDGLKIEKENLEKAIEAWRQRGERIGKVISKPCNERPNFGEIAFYYNPDIVGWTHHGKAQTSRYKGTDRLAYARVWLGNEKLDSVELLEHELGHGLGYKDTHGYFSDNIMSTNKPLEY